MQQLVEVTVRARRIRTVVDDLYDGWAEGPLQVRSLILSNRGMVPTVILDGCDLEMGVYRPPTWLIPVSRLPFFNLLIQTAVWEYLCLNGFKFQGTPATRAGIDGVRKVLFDAEKALAERMDIRQFWLCLARAFTLEV